MSKVLTDNQHYSDIANAIRSKYNSTDTYKPSEMAPAISAIPDRKSILIIQHKSGVEVIIQGPDGNTIENSKEIDDSALYIEISILGRYIVSASDETEIVLIDTLGDVYIVQICTFATSSVLCLDGSTTPTTTETSYAKRLPSAVSINNYAIFGPGLNNNTAATGGYTTAYDKYLVIHLLGAIFSSSRLKYTASCAFNNYAIFAGGSTDDSDSKYSCVNLLYYLNEQLTNSHTTTKNVACCMTACGIADYLLVGGGCTYNRTTTNLNNSYKDMQAFSSSFTAQTVESLSIYDNLSISMFDKAIILPRDSNNTGLAFESYDNSLTKTVYSYLGIDIPTSCGRTASYAVVGNSSSDMAVIDDNLTVIANTFTIQIPSNSSNYHQTAFFRNRLWWITSGYYFVNMNDSLTQHLTDITTSARASIGNTNNLSNYSIATVDTYLIAGGGVNSNGTCCVVADTIKYDYR